MDHKTLKVHIYTFAAYSVKHAHMFRRLFKTQTRQDKLLGLLCGYAERLRICAENSEKPDSDRFWNMAGYIEGIAKHIRNDARDAAKLRIFITHYLKKIIEIIESWVVLNAHTADFDGSEKILRQIADYEQLLKRAERACLLNDFRDIELSMSAFEQQIKRLDL